MDIDSHIRRTLEGDARAYAQVVRTYERMVYTVCHRVLRNRADAEEATQDSFVKAYQHLHGWNRSARFSTWLYSIAYRTAVSMVRTRKPDTVDIDAIDPPTGADGPPVHARDDLRLHLDRALATLPPEDASILSFFYLEEMSVEEIVTATGLGASNVKVRLHRGRKKLLDILQQQLGGEARDLLMEDHA